MKKIRSSNKIFAKCLLKDRFGTRETGLTNLFIEEELYVVEIRCCVPISVGQILLETDDGLAEKADDCVSFAIFKTQPTSRLESKAVKEKKICSTCSVEYHLGCQQSQRSHSLFC